MRRRQPADAGPGEQPGKARGRPDAAGESIHAALARAAGVIAGVCPGLALAVVLTSLLLAAEGPLLVFFTARLVTAEGSGRFHELYTAAAGLAITAAAAQFLRPLSVALRDAVGDRAGSAVGLMALRAANRHPGLHLFEDPAWLDRMQFVETRAQSDLAEIPSSFAQLLQQSFTVCCFGFILARWQAAAPLVLIALSIPRAAAEYAFIHVSRSGLEAQAAEARLLSAYRSATLSLASVKDVLHFGLGAFLRARYSATFDSVTRKIGTQRASATRRLLLLASLQYAGAAGMIFAAAVSGPGGASGAARFVLVSGSALGLIRSITLAGGMVGFLLYVLRNLPALWDVLDAAPALAVSGGAAPPAVVREGIEFRDVRFTYPGTRAEVLRGVSFRVSPGEVVAIVGANGAGKSTLVKLLTRLYDPTAGRITVDGIDLGELDVDRWRDRIGVVFQEFGRYAFTVAENITLGAEPDGERVREAARGTGLHARIDRLPNAYDTILSAEFGGVDLSGGEWQRLALARLFLRRRPIVILDEPTAALDVRGEAQFQEQLRTQLHGRTGLLISHRMSTARAADRILVLDGGRVIEEGTHDELMASGGVYARYFRLQASPYAEGAA